MNNYIFKYRKVKRLGEIIVISTIAGLLATISGENSFQFTTLLILVLLSTVLIYLISYFYMLNESIEIDSKFISINKKLGKSISIPFDEIRRIVIREEQKTFQSNQYKMTIFGKNRNSEIIVSEIYRQSEMVKLLEDKAEELGFNIIHQSLSGQHIDKKSIRKNLRGA